MLLDLRLYYKVRVINRLWYWGKSRHTDWWNRIEGPEINTHICGQSTTKKAKIYNKHKTVSQLWCLKNWTGTCKRIKLACFLRKINSKWTKDLRPETIKLLEENIGSTLFDISFTNTVFWSIIWAKEAKVKINKCYLIKPRDRYPGMWSHKSALKWAFQASLQTKLGEVME